MMDALLVRRQFTKTAESIVAGLKHFCETGQPVGGNYGCLIVNTASALAAHRHPACEEFVDYQQYLTKLFHNALARAKARKQVCPETDTTAPASFFFGIVLGLNVYTKYNPGTDVREPWPLSVADEFISRTHRMRCPQGTSRADHYIRYTRRREGHRTIRGKGTGCFRRGARGCRN